MGVGEGGAEGGVADVPEAGALAGALGAAEGAVLAAAADLDFWYLRLTWFT